MHKIGDQVKIHMFDHDSIWHNKIGTIIHHNPVNEMYHIFFNTSMCYNIPIPNTWFHESQLRSIKD